MHVRRKGKSGSKKPSRKRTDWLGYGPKEIEEMIVKLAKEDKTPSEIGTILRDSYGIPSVSAVTKKKITQILEENKLAQKLPYDMLALIQKEVAIMKHMDANKKDMSAKRGLQLTDSKIRRLVKYYKKIGRLPADWKYDKKRAKLLLE